METRGGKRGSQRKQDRRMKCSASVEIHQQMRVTIPDRKLMSFFGVLLRQVILMRHDILFCREGWQAMPKLTDGQEISIREQNKMEIIFWEGKWEC